MEGIGPRWKVAVPELMGREALGVSRSEALRGDGFAVDVGPSVVNTHVLGFASF